MQFGQMIAHDTEGNLPKTSSEYSRIRDLTLLKFESKARNAYGLKQIFFEENHKFNSKSQHRYTCKIIFVLVINIVILKIAVFSVYDMHSYL